MVSMPLFHPVMVYAFLYVIVDALNITTMTTPQVKEMNHSTCCNYSKLWITQID